MSEPDVDRSGRCPARTRVIAKAAVYRLTIGESERVEAPAVRPEATCRSRWLEDFCDRVRGRGLGESCRLDADGCGYFELGANRVRTREHALG